MGRGRRTLGVGHVDSLEGAPEDRERLRTILLTITGELTVKDASSGLGLSPARFAELRRQALQGALSGLAPGRPGRPRLVRDEVGELEELREKVGWLEEELQCSRLRTEIALSLPHLLRRAEAEKKGSSPHRPGRRGEASGDRSGT